MDAIIWNGGIPNPRKVIYRYLGAYKIAHAARKAGHSVQVIDHVADMDLETLYSATKKFITPDTSIIGISMTWLLSQTNLAWPCGRRSIMPWHIYRCISMIRQEHPGIRWVAGGYNSNKLGSDLPVHEVVDGYAEAIFTELMDHAKGLGDEPESEIRPSTADAGISRKVYTNPRRLVHDICQDDHLYSKQDCIQPGETLPIEISRGCMFKCRFCHHLLLGRKKLDYLRSFEMVKNQIVHNHENWGTTRYYVICDTFNDTTVKMDMWHGMVSSLPFRISYHAYLRADLLDRYPEVPYQLLESGLEGSYHGIESLDEEASRVAGKAWSGKHAREYMPRLIGEIWGNRVRSTLSFIAGLPGDTREKLIDTAEWLRDFRPYHATFQPLRIFPNPGHRHRSEFDINHESYGYSFPMGDELNWKLPYWYRFEAEHFSRFTIDPMLNDFRSLFSSWQASCLLGMGHQPEIVDPAWQKKAGHRRVGETLEQARRSYLSGYISDLMKL